MQTYDIDLASAKAMIAAAESRAEALGVNATTVVVDRGGGLVAMTRMNGSWPGGFDLALGKAQTARSFLAPSSAFVTLIQPGAPLFAVNSVAMGKYVILGGGIPILVDGQIAGAVGVSGGTVEQDEIIVEAAIRALANSSEED